MNESHSADRPWLSLALAASLSLAVGCGGRDRVAGKVTLNGAPVKGGVVTFLVGQEQKAGSINAEGEYVVERPPRGAARVTVQGAATELRMPVPRRAAGKDARQLPAPAASDALPGKYAKPDNGLTFEVTGGRQTFDIALTP
jgi:hypothetical protein